MSNHLNVTEKQKAKNKTESLGKVLAYSIFVVMFCLFGGMILTEYFPLEAICVLMGGVAPLMFYILGHKIGVFTAKESS